MSDATRYHESFPLIQQLAAEVDFLLITAHLGRPQAQEAQFSFRNICETLSKDLGKPVTFVTNLEQLTAL
jgi:3-phosphoglycerate kinase